MSGEWTVTHGDTLTVELLLGESVYEASLGIDGGVIEIDHEGTPLTFNLDCADELILCPTEAWAASLTMGQQPVNSQSEIPIDLPAHVCTGEVTIADIDACAENLGESMCEWICDAEVVIEDRERIARLTDKGESFMVLFAQSVTGTGSACTLGPFSRAEAEVVSAGGELDEAWEAEALTNGTLELTYSGRCLSTGAIADPELEAAVAEATLTVRTSFEGARME